MLKQLSFVLLAMVMTLVSLADETTVIHGKLKNSDASRVTLETLARHPVEMATADLNKGGAFTLSLPLSEHGFYRIKTGEGNPDWVVILHPGDEVHMQLDQANPVSGVKVKGSRDNMLLYKAKNDILPFTSQRDSLNKKLTAARRDGLDNEERAFFKEGFNELKMKQNEVLRKMMAKDPGSLAWLFFIEQFDLATNISLYEKVDNALFAQYPDDPFVGGIHAKVVGERLLALGNVAPDISLPNPDGVVTNLASLRGKVVLIDFWASWCHPCRRENPNVVRMYNDYNKEGFEVFSVSLDKDHDKWVRAIETDGLRWTHVSDLKFWQSAAAKKYGVKSIPFTVLIDRDGTILGKNLRGADLEAKLKSIFGH